MMEIIKMAINATGAIMAKVTILDITVASRGRPLINQEVAIMVKGAEVDAEVANSAEIRETLIVVIMHPEVKLKHKIKDAIKSYMLY
jgi:hypothetical protein